MEIDRLTGITESDFLSHVTNNEPMIISDCMKDCYSDGVWTPEYFRSEFGSEIVQVYDDLFGLKNVSPLGDYIDRYFGKATPDINIPYVRWYSKFKDKDFCWADKVFDLVASDWVAPYFIPKTDYILPFCASPKTIDPVHDLFPARGIFVSALGAKTRLHVDPWCSDALLVQLFGEKKWLMYSPSGGVRNGPDLSFTLRRGEAVFIPRNWKHHVLTVSDSISLTWNFVHKVSKPEFLSYLTKEISKDDLEVIYYFMSSEIQEKPATLDNLAKYIEIHS